VLKSAQKTSKGVQFSPIFAKKWSIFAKNPFIFRNFLKFLRAFILPILPARYNRNGHSPAYLIENLTENEELLGLFYV